MEIRKVLKNNFFIQANFGMKKFFSGKDCGEVGGKACGWGVGNGCGKVEKWGFMVDKWGFSTQCTHFLHGDFHRFLRDFLSVICGFSMFYTDPITINIKYII